MPYQFKSTNILVIDDMKPMLALTASLLGILGFENVMTASDADTGFRKFLMHNPDIVITDWLMEPYDGTELIRKIRTDPKSPNPFVPIIMMTGYSHRVRVEQARDSGITEFLVKPFRGKDLYARIEQLIEKPRRFVDVQSFFGPDRRRRKPDHYTGPSRRGSDTLPEGDDILREEALGLLRDLKKKAQKTAKSSKNKEKK
ncbi:MAG: response regulator [Alphaproteobacteria bacterium CG_4_9_14_3_um_filter_47_13]|nr:MAG: response regulator [Alphaproteobacteria bacterium CG_4_9_14_3_um_filter_47_13]